MYKTDINYGPKIDYEHCNKCGTCYQHCPMDVFGWDEEKQMPTVAYAAECSFCCFCETMCIRGSNRRAPSSPSNAGLWAFTGCIEERIQDIGQRQMNSVSLICLR